MNDLVSEFFYDGIARIPAGLLIIVLYWRTETENIFHTQCVFWRSPLLFIVCVLAIAWLVGGMVDAITFVPFRFGLEWSRRLQTAATAKSGFCRVLVKFIARCRSLLLDEKELEELAIARLRSQHVGEEALKELLESDKGWAREMRRKAYYGSGLRMMSRCLWFIFAFALLRPPEPFSNIHWNGNYSFAGFCVFMILWLSLTNCKRAPIEKNTQQS